MLGFTWKIQPQIMLFPNGGDSVANFNALKVERGPDRSEVTSELRTTESGISLDPEKKINEILGPSQRFARQHKSKTDFITQLDQSRPPKFSSTRYFFVVFPCLRTM